MTSIVIRLAALGAVLVLAGCGTGAPPEPAASIDAPDLHGAWTGSWGGTPLTLLIRAQDADGGDGGLYVGSWQVAGRTAPTVSGILTFTRRGEAVSTGMQGWLRGGGRRTLVVETQPSDGRQELVLNVAGDRLTGNGTSSFRWGPQGEIDLRRVSPHR